MYFRDFERYDTGGGCEAIKYDTSFGYFLVTSKDGMSIPLINEKDILFAIYFSRPDGEEDQLYFDINLKTGRCKLEFIDGDLTSPLEPEMLTYIYSILSNVLWQDYDTINLLPPLLEQLTTVTEKE